jgi:protoporphyrinogen IX oxidase
MVLDALTGAYVWIKALHVIAVISWMAGMFYLPRLFVYHAERAVVGGELDRTFQVMELKLMKVIMNPAMIATWFFGGLLALIPGVVDWGSVWAWVKVASVLAMTAAHMWLARRRREFAAGQNSRSGRTYRLANEVPTVLMILIVVAVIARPF